MSDRALNAHLKKALHLPFVEEYVERVKRSGVREAKSFETDTGTSEESAGAEYSCTRCRIGRSDAFSDMHD